MAHRVIREAKFLDSISQLKRVFQKLITGLKSSILGDVYIIKYWTFCVKREHNFHFCILDGGVFCIMCNLFFLF